MNSAAIEGHSGRFYTVPGSWNQLIFTPLFKRALQCESFTGFVMTQLPRMHKSVSQAGGWGEVKKNRMGTAFILPPDLRDKYKGWKALAPPCPCPALIFWLPTGASSRTQGLFREVASQNPSGAWYLDNGLFYNLRWLLISHWEGRIWQEPRFLREEKETNSERVGGFAMAATQIIPDRKKKKMREHKSNIRSRITVFQWLTRKKNLENPYFKSILLKIGNAREALADRNLFWSDKLEAEDRPGKSDTFFPLTVFFF